MVSIILPILGIAIATTIICYLILKSPLMEPFKQWLWWGVLALGVLWITFDYVLPLFGVHVR